jgi:hypothetical protein
MLKPFVTVAALALLAQPAAPSLAEVLQRAGAYAVDYESRFSLLVAEERYEQLQTRQTSVSGGAAAMTTLSPGGENRREQRRTLLSDYLLVRLDGGGWMPFRDVFEVDGRKVRDREERMLNLFLTPGATSLDQARRIMADSTRHNLGSVQRTINIPTLAVLLVQPPLATRFAFDREGDESIDGTPAWVVSYKETARPTLIRTTNGRDLALSGKLWIEPGAGAIVKTSMAVSDASLRASTVVTFAKQPDLDFLVPSRMEESYSAQASEVITCVATYSRYRRFTVATDERIRKPGE